MPETPESSPFRTQDWEADGRLLGLPYGARRVTFEVQGTPMVGNLLTPSGPGPHPGVALVGPVAFVKEQSPMQYATRLVRAGFAALVFDPRHHGESGGEQRRLESGPLKVEDLHAALDLLAARPEVDASRLHLLGLCQGVNWAVEAAQDPRVRALALVAGHYLMPETARMYLGPDIEPRLARARAARADHEATGEVAYIPIVSPRPEAPDPDALLLAPPIQQFYARWADRGPFWDFHGLWENRIAAHSEEGLWSHDVRPHAARLTVPTLMVHADRAASGPKIPRAVFDAVPAARKELVWLGRRNQMQFYEDPLSIDLVVAHVARFFLEG